MEKASYWIKKLNLQQHPEGGYFSETFRSSLVIPSQCLPELYFGNRNAATSIYFLLECGDFSSLHQLKSGELWYHHLGNPVDIYMIHPDGKLEIKTLGKKVEEGQHLQLVIPAGVVFGAIPDGNEGFSLAGCMVAPGFEFMDFKLFERETLTKMYPQHHEIITMLTRK